MGKFLAMALVAMTFVGSVSQANVADARGHRAQADCCVPPPVEVTWCVEDPCTCCKVSVSACLPACCQCQTPCLVGWRSGLLGRKILTYKFPCGECVEIVLTKHGKATVRA